MARPYDVVVFGSTGFTGTLICEYLAQKEGLKWAVSGRNEQKLSALVAKLSAAGAKSAPAPLVCSIDDKESLHRVVGSARVLISAAGPFAKVGTPVVEACVAVGTDYCDITGEVAWVRSMVDRFGAEAEAKGVLLCSCCGYDSIPSDLGTFYGIGKLREAFGPATRVGFVGNYGVSRGAPSGGTLASGINMEKDPELARQMQDPFLLGGRPANGPRAVDADFVGAEFDPKIGSWIAPFGMAGINTRVVRKSAGLLGYGPAFAYREVSIAPNEEVAKKMARVGPPAAKREEMVKAGRLPGPGEGPSAEVRAKSFFRMHIRVEAEDSPERAVFVKVSGGDPGYTETAKMVSEAALCLAHQRAVLPVRGGFHTPASAMGSSLIERLVANGITFEQTEAPSASRAKL
mmetsp:Transcript_2369/g.7318  ORF Transcript_2369/g.7318 Transcript_2369/m.7318 type:complete len:403 (-) Transcript_2369:143-1351(-)